MEITFCHEMLIWHKSMLYHSSTGEGNTIWTSNEILISLCCWQFLHPMVHNGAQKWSEFFSKNIPVPHYVQLIIIWPMLVTDVTRIWPFQLITYLFDGLTTIFPEVGQKWIRCETEENTLGQKTTALIINIVEGDLNHRFKMNCCGLFITKKNTWRNSK